MAFGDDIERVKAVLDPVALISSYLPLKRAGKGFISRCPFHQDKTPSFHVSPEGLFYCFGCGVGGDALRFIELKEGVDFKQALEKAAQFAGIVLTPPPTQSPHTATNFNQGLQLLSRASSYFHRLLLESSKAEQARAFLAERGVSNEAIVRFELGYAWGAEHDWSSLVKKKHWSIDLSVQVSLTASSRQHDRFEHRIMFPIANIRGQVVGFGGRRLLADQPAKYINSSDSPWFHKGHLLYGHHLAQEAWRQIREAILCEGYLDVIGLHMAGFTQAVAPLGTALTDKQAALIASRVETVFLAFDSDAAGRKAALNAWALLSDRGCIVKMVVLPSGEDPDSYLVKQGGQAFKQCLVEATDFWSFFLDSQIKSAQDLSTKRQALEALVEKLAGFTDTIHAELRLAELAHAAQVSQSSIMEKWQHYQKQQNNSSAPAIALPDHSTHGIPRGIEEYVARYILQYPAERFSLNEELRGYHLHPWLKALLEGRQDADPQFSNWLGQMRFKEPRPETRESLLAALNELHEKRLRQEKISHLQQQQAALLATGNYTEAKIILQEIHNLHIRE